MPLMSFDLLFQAVDSRRPMTPLAAAGGADATVLEALRIASGRGWITPQVVGVEAEVRRVARWRRRTGRLYAGRRRGRASAAVRGFAVDRPAC